MKKKRVNNNNKINETLIITIAKANDFTIHLTIAALHDFDLTRTGQKWYMIMFFWFCLFFCCSSFVDIFHSPCMWYLACFFFFFCFVLFFISSLSLHVVLFIYFVLIRLIRFTWYVFRFVCLDMIVIVIIGGKENIKEPFTYYSLVIWFYFICVVGYIRRLRIHLYMCVS